MLEEDDCKAAKESASGCPETNALLYLLEREVTYLVTNVTMVFYFANE